MAQLNFISTKVRNPQTGQFVDVAMGGNSNNTCYGVCTTSGNTAAKTVTVTPWPGLSTGLTITVFFVKTNSASSPTLNVNGSGDIGIRRYANQAAGTTEDTSWNQGSTVSLTYDGSFWIINNHIDNTDARVTTYTDTGKIYLTGTKYSANGDNDNLWKNSDVYENSGTIYATDFQAGSVSLKDDTLPILYKQYNYTSRSSSLAATGLSYTVPANTICRVTGAITSNNNAIVKAQILAGSTVVAESTPISSSSLSTTVLAIVGSHGSPTTVELYGQWNGTSSNCASLIIEKLG